MNNQFEIINTAGHPSGKIRAAVFDFDGTISTLRCGWEQVMDPMMLEYLSPGKEPSPALKEKVSRFIDESTGIQTVYQMQWLSEQADALTGIKHDAWFYKDEYNRRLMLNVSKKKQTLENRNEKPEKYLVGGSVKLLEALKERGISLYLASGTDHKDVLKESELLGVKDYFTEILGAPERIVACSKETVLRNLFEEKRFSGSELLVVGDGKVEISLAKHYGAFALGAATNEESGRGINPVKRERLINAGADAITGDFINRDAILKWIDG